MIVRQHFFFQSCDGVHVGAHLDFFKYNVNISFSFFHNIMSD